MAIARDDGSAMSSAFSKMQREQADLAAKQAQAELDQLRQAAQGQVNAQFPWQQGLAGMAQQNWGGSFQSAMSQPAQVGVTTIGPAQVFVLKSPKLLPSETMVHAIVGWRRWSVGMFDSVLRSNNQTVWKPYERMEASCKLMVDTSNPPPCRGVECSCGIYAYKDRKDAEHGENAPSAVTHIWGEVWLWGRVIECQRGFRAQFAYPKAFVGQRGSIAQQVAEAYGVKLIAED